MRSPALRAVVFIAVVAAVAACDYNGMGPDCPDPAIVSLSSGDALIVRSGGLGLPRRCSSDLVLGTTTLRDTVVSIKTRTDTLRLRFRDGSVLAAAEYDRDPSLSYRVDVISGALDRSALRGTFEVAVHNGGLFTVIDSLRGRFYAALAED